MSASPATADDIRVVPLTKGDQAPFSGQLLSYDAAASLGTKAELCSEKAKLQRDHDHRMCMAKLDQIEQINAVRGRALLDKVTVLEAALEASREGQEIPFWDEPAFIWPTAFAAGAVVTSAVIFGSIWAYGQVTR